MNKNKRSCKLSCATQLQVWYAVEKISFRLQFQCGEHLFWGGRKLIFVNKWLCLFALKQSATSLSFVLFICFPIKVRPNPTVHPKGIRARSAQLWQSSLSAPLRRCLSLEAEDAFLLFRLRLRLCAEVDCNDEEVDLSTRCQHLSICALALDQAQALELMRCLVTDRLVVDDKLRLDDLALASTHCFTASTNTSVGTGGMSRRSHPY